MRKTIYSFSLFCASMLALSCSDDSASDDFEEVNGNVEQKLIKSMSLVSAQDSDENESIVLSYNTNGSLNTITTGDDTSIFVYENSELTNISGGGDTFNMEELYESPYDAFETGDVLEYDENGNPELLEFREDEYDYDMDDYVTKLYTAELVYDDAPNPFYYTLQAGGLIDVLDGVQLNFSVNPQLPEIVQARLLFPVNNLSQIIYKDEEGEIVYTINANFVYDEDNYPTSATVTAVSSDYDDQDTFTTTFTYVE
ncbi:hypothetical protein [Maribacter luteus]|uniref:hypothetical protein n=1 Tax=Maribacter luteus TaxID=2594478 RepID=UPI002491453F|nr:hypothetical protein [Maribacter luteus]